MFMTWCIWAILCKPSHHILLHCILLLRCKSSLSNLIIIIREHWILFQRPGVYCNILCRYVRFYCVTFGGLF